MSPSSLESQIAEHTDHYRITSSESARQSRSQQRRFSALEDRVARTVSLVKTERQARAAAEQRAESLDSQLSEQLTLVKTLQEEIRSLGAERDLVRQRVEKLLTQLDSLEL